MGLGGVSIGAGCRFSETMGMLPSPASAPGGLARTGWVWEATWVGTSRRRCERAGAGHPSEGVAKAGARGRARSAPELRKGQDCWG